MGRFLICLILSFGIVLTTPIKLRAESASATETPTEGNPADAPSEQKYVGKASQEASEEAKSSTRRNVLLAAGAVAVAVIAVLIVSSNKGHSDPGATD